MLGKSGGIINHKIELVSNVGSQASTKNNCNIRVQAITNKTMERRLQNLTLDIEKRKKLFYEQFE